ncbi:MAG: acetyl-CoA carboxylase, carboxyltransferase subunit beta [Planctomycetota bacterium]|jgi:acetyl-CoA carboxylase carboxyl transferase subunit beta|nr:acetyl-CoA carboxylase, carboxyltransferase subunit beta [Planctomycetota bacterium]
MAFRLRKKKDMPGGLWSKCPSCNKMIYSKDLEQNMSVCPECGFHNTISARKRIEITADPGTFVEHFSDLKPKDRLEFVDNIPYSDKIAKAQEKTGNADALLAGQCCIGGQPAVIAVLDFTFMGGSMGEVVGEKITRAVELAAEKRVPVLIFSASGGARMHEGAISLMQMAKTCGALKKFSLNGGFSISAMTNPTTGGVTASFASICDITVAEPDALIGFAGPRVIQNTIRQELPDGFQRSEFLLDKGQVDMIITRDNMREKLGQLLGYAAKQAVSS